MKDFEKNWAMFFDPVLNLTTNLYRDTIHNNICDQPATPQATSYVSKREKKTNT